MLVLQKALHSLRSSQPPHGLAIHRRSKIEPRQSREDFKVVELSIKGPDQLRGDIQFSQGSARVFSNPCRPLRTLHTLLQAMGHPFEPEERERKTCRKQRVHKP